MNVFQLNNSFYIRLTVACTALILWLCQSVSASDIDGIRFGNRAGDTRIVIDLGDKITPRVFLLAEPERVVIDFEGGKWNTSHSPKSLGFVSRYRHGLFTPNMYRIVLDLTGPVHIKRSFLLEPNNQSGYRYVIDLAKSSTSKFLAEVKSSRDQRVANTRTDTQGPSNTYTASSALTSSKDTLKPLIVLDAGHGGTDPGTLGVLGVNEKVITLAVAKEVKSQLEKNGRYRVRLTRGKDFFIPVRKRFEIARGWRADLFISIHADAIGNPKVRGGSIYTLSEKASDREAARLAARENKSDLIAGLNLNESDQDVSVILLELAQRETLNYSARFAELLLPEMRKELSMHKRGHRYANFGVLKAPDVPSVLIETGYLSNRADAKVLASKNGQRKIAVSIKKAVDQYFERLLAQSR